MTKLVEIRRKRYAKMLGLENPKPGELMDAMEAARLKQSQVQVKTRKLTNAQKALI